MAPKAKKKLDAEAAAKAVEEALDVELDFDDLVSQDVASAETGAGPDVPDLNAMNDEEVFNELERKLAEAANDLKSPEKNGPSATAPSKRLEHSAHSASLQTQSDAGGQTPAESEFQAMTSGTAAGLEPANDDRKDTVAELVYGLQKRPSPTPLIVATILSLGWLALVGYFVNFNEASLLDASISITEKLSQTKTYLYLGIALIPILMIWSFAVMVRRAQEMRQAAKSMTEAAIRLMQPEGIATDSITTVGRAIRREVAAMGDGVELALGRASELESLIQGEVLNLQRSYSDSEIRLRGLLADLTTERETVVGHAERLKTSISGSHAGLSEELQEAGGRIQSVIDNATQKLTETLSNKEQGITATLSQAGENLVSLLSNSGSDLENRISAGSQKLHDSLNTGANDLSEKIEIAGSSMASLLQTQSANLQNVSATATQQFEDAISIRVADFSMRIDESGNTLQDALDSRLTKLDDTIGIKGDAFVEALGTRTDALDKVLSERTSVISETLKERLSLFGNSMTSHLDKVTNELTMRQESLEKTTDAIGSSIMQRSEDLEKNLYQKHADIAASLQNGLSAVTLKAEEIRKGIDEQSGTMISGMDTRTQTLIGELDQRIKDLTSGVENNAESLKALMEQKTVSLVEAISSGSEILFTGLDAQTSNLKADIDGRSASLLDGLTARSSRIASALDERIGSITSKVDSSAEVLNSIMDEKAANMAKAIGDGTEALLHGIDTKGGAIKADIEKRSSNLLDGLSQQSSGFAKGIEERVGSIEQSLSDKTETLKTIIASGETAILSSVEGKYGLFSKMLEERQNAISIDLDSKIEATAGTLDEKAAAISNILTERAALVNATLGEGLTNNQRMLEEKSKEFNDLLSSRSSELSKILDETALPLVEQIKTQGDDVAGKLGTVHKSVSEDVGDLLNRLASISVAMSELIDKAGSDLGHIESTIMQQASTMSDAVGKARHDVDQSSELAQNAHIKMDETAKNLLANIAGIAERFEQQGNMLEHATRMIDNAQRNFSQTLEDREGSLEVLASGLSARTSEIEQSMAAFGEMLTRTMDEMTQRSRLVGSTVSSEVGTAIEETTARFAAATEAMRQASQDVRQDLEATRNEMRKGVMELPDETRQSADAMRKVVADQIAALRDLSEIVTKSGKSLDTAPARSTPQKQFASGGASRPLAAPRPQPTAPAFVNRDPQGTPSRQSATQARQQTAAPVNRDAFAPRKPRNPIPKAGLSPVPSRGNTGNSGNAKGWVSDLLKRASREDEPKQSQSNRQNELHRIESLNSLSMDIARLMDDETSVDLWDRYQRGERNVFTRRLYTLQGQQTFDEIQLKYNSEPEFRFAVDRYMDDFERLLGDVAQNDRDNIMTQTYLTSDTGKVYTMLAHAAGRLGS